MWNRKRRHITPSATITVRRRGRNYLVRVATSEALAEFVLDNEGPVEWLIGRDLSGCVVAGMTWGELVDAISSQAASEHLSRVVVVKEPVRAAYNTDQLQELLNEHYRQVLSSPEGRRMWRRLLADEAAARRLGMKK